MRRNAVFIMCMWASTLLAMDPTIVQGSSRLKFSFAQAKATDYFDRNGLAAPMTLGDRPAEYQNDSYRLEYTFGLQDDLAVVVQTDQEKNRLETNRLGLGQNGISQYYLGVRQQIGSSSSARFLVETGAAFGQKSADPLPLSAGGTTWFALMGYTQEFMPSRAGFEMDGGYVRRGGDAADEFVFSTKLHLDVLQVVDITLGYSVVESRKDRKIVYALTEWPNERGSQSGEFRLSRALGSSFLVSLGYHSLLRGRNQFETDGFELGVTWWRQ